MAIPAPPGDWTPLQGTVPCWGFSTDLCCWQVTLSSSSGGLGLVGKVHLELPYSLPPCHYIQEPIEQALKWLGKEVDNQQILLGWLKIHVELSVTSS